VKIQQDARNIADGRNRPLGPQSRNIRLLELDIGGSGPYGSDFLDALTALMPADRAWLGAQQRTYRIDLALAHLQLPSAMHAT
jgi:hypothetical protein